MWPSFQCTAFYLTNLCSALEPRWALGRCVWKPSICHTPLSQLLWPSFQCTLFVPYQLSECPGSTMDTWKMMETIYLYRTCVDCSVCVCARWNHHGFSHAG